MGITERKEREKLQRKNDIIKSAEKIFFKKGFTETTMDDIANDAELSKGTLYLYFKNKNVLLFEIVKLKLDKLKTKLIETYDENISGLENMHKIKLAYVDFVEKDPNHLKSIVYFDKSIFNNLDNDEKNTILEDDSTLHFFAQIIIKGQNDGSIIKNINPIQLALTLWTQTTGVISFASEKDFILDLLKISKSDFIMNQFDILINGITA